MARLTEEMVIARSRQSDLSTIKKLNCWGSDLSDVSIIKRMRGVEVLALSVNKINGLSDFENCIHLKELYLRKNNIQDLQELAYLQGLTELKHLWLEENPCVDNAGPNYRAMVLRALPYLKKLDNIDVTAEEVADAQKGNVKREEVYEEPYHEPPQQQQQQQQYRQTSPVREQSQQTPENTETECIVESNITTSIPTSPLQRTPSNPDNYSPPETNHPTSPRYQRDNRGSYQYDRSPGSDQDSPGGYRDRVPIAPSMSSHSMKEYYQSDYQKQPPSQYRHSQVDLSEWDEQQQQNNHNNREINPAQHTRRVGDRDVPHQYRNGHNNGSREEWDDNDRRRETRRPEGRYSDTASVVSNAVLSHYANLHRRPVNRNSNLLSAILCLVKELDYPSLEVVEHAVRCRIDELSAD